MSHDKHPCTPFYNSGGVPPRGLCTEVAPLWGLLVRESHGVRRILTHLEMRSMDAGVPTEQRHTKWTDGPAIKRVGTTTGSAMQGCERIAISNNTGCGNG